MVSLLTNRYLWLSVVVWELLLSMIISAKILPELLKEFQVVHLCGKGKTDESLNGTAGYVQYEYIQDELPDLFAMLIS